MPLMPCHDAVDAAFLRHYAGFAEGHCHIAAFAIDCRLRCLIFTISPSFHCFRQAIAAAAFAFADAIADYAAATCR